MIVPLKKMPLFPWEGLAFEINLFQVVPAFCTFYDFQANIYDTVYFPCHYAALQHGGMYYTFLCKNNLEHCCLLILYSEKIKTIMR